MWQPDIKEYLKKFHEIKFEGFEANSGQSLQILTTVVTHHFQNCYFVPWDWLKSSLLHYLKLHWTSRENPASAWHLNWKIKREIKISNFSWFELIKIIIEKKLIIILSKTSRLKREFTLLVCQIPPKSKKTENHYKKIPSRSR